MPSELAPLLEDGAPLAQLDDCVMLDDSPALRGRLAAVAEHHERTRCLDRFELVLPLDSARRTRVLCGFFDAIAADYDELIEASRNLANIGLMLDRLLAEGVPGGLPVLDFGAGGGLSLDAAAQRGLNVLGFDVCAGMRDLARRRGMLVDDPDDLAARAGHSLGGGFASYVLHLEPCPPSLPDVWRCLAPGAAFVGNFHKARGLERFTRFAHEMGIEVEHLPPVPGAEHHGPFAICRKRRGGAAAALNGR